MAERKTSFSKVFQACSEMEEMSFVDDDKSVVATSMIDQFDCGILGVMSFQIVESNGCFSGVYSAAYFFVAFAQQHKSALVDVVVDYLNADFCMANQV